MHRNASARMGSTVARLLQFNLVGMLGTAVQLGTLAVLNRLLPAHYLLTSALALELSLLHNFVWHTHYTWRDREVTASPARQLLRFHLANGLVSLAGNLLLMRVLVQGAHLPVVLSNFIAIVACSGANFLLSHRWVFARPVRWHARHAVAACVLLCGAVAHAQQGGEAIDSAYVNAFVGPATSFQAGDGHATFTGGVTFGQYFTRPRGEGVPVSPQFELGVVGPLPGGHTVDGLASINAMLAGPMLPHRRVFLFVTAGYSRLFVTGNALNVGLGVDIGRITSDRMLRIELRDYGVFSGSPQNLVSLRFGLGKLIAD